MLALAIAIDRFRISAMIHAFLLLLGQTGSTKTAIGWLIVLLCIGLGLLVVCRPSGRKSPLKR